MFYSPASEIEAYIKRTVKKYNLDKPVKFNSKVLETVWDEETGKWKIKVEVDGKIQEDEADILVNGAGFLKSVTQDYDLAKANLNSKWKWPQIPGLFDFKGKLVHTAKW
jgi:cation diffusion facilitator CzcD-associated flavoprotein CzcO